MKNFVGNREIDASTSEDLYSLHTDYLKTVESISKILILGNLK